MWPWSAIADLRERVSKLEDAAYITLSPAISYPSCTRVPARDVLHFLAVNAGLRWHFGTPGSIVTRDDVLREEARQSGIRG